MRAKGPAHRAGPFVTPSRGNYLHCMQASPFTMMGSVPDLGVFPTFGRPAAVRASGATWRCPPTGRVAPCSRMAVVGFELRPDREAAVLDRDARVREVDRRRDRPCSRTAAEEFRGARSGDRGHRTYGPDTAEQRDPDRHDSGGDECGHGPDRQVDRPSPEGCSLGAHGSPLPFGPLEDLCLMRRRYARRHQGRCRAARIGGDVRHLDPVRRSPERGWPAGPSARPATDERGVPLVLRSREALHAGLSVDHDRLMRSREPGRLLGDGGPASDVSKDGQKTSAMTAMITTMSTLATRSRSMRTPVERSRCSYSRGVLS